MKPHQKSGRSRSKNNRSKGGGGGGYSPNRVYESAGPEGKVRGTPQQIIDKYEALARDAQTSGDRVVAENFLQHAEHYARILSASQSANDQRRSETQQGQPQHQQGQDDQPGGQQGGQDRSGEGSGDQRDHRGDQRDQRGGDQRGGGTAGEGDQPYAQERATTPAGLATIDPGAEDGPAADLVATPEAKEKPPARRPRRRKPAASAEAKPADAGEGEAKPASAPAVDEAAAN